MLLARMLPELSRATAIGWADSPCPLCGSPDSDVVCEAQDPNVEAGLVFSVVKCRACGLRFTNPRPDEESIGAFYPADYKPHRRTGKPARRPSRFGWLTGTDASERRGDLGIAPGRLLDFGCGGGSYLARMASLGWDVVGVDPSETAVRHVREVMKVRAMSGSLPSRELAPGSFDAVTMWHSLEHVHDPLAVLRETYRLLKPGGLLLVSVPNIDGAMARWFGPDWFGLDLPRHLTHFTADSLREMLAAAGFRVAHLRGVKHSDWLRSSARLAHRRGRATLLQSACRWKPAAWLTWATGTCDCLLAKAVRAA